MRMPQLEELLQKYFGYTQFRPPQKEIIRSIIAGRDTFSLLPTGNGKSLCFQIAALCFPHLTLVISPLLSLMYDQVYQLKKQGIPVALWTSDTSPAEEKVLKNSLRQGDLKLLYLSPEKLWSHTTQSFLQAIPISHICVDEAHCISQWGHDFRPEYRLIARFTQALAQKQARPVISAFTATATQNVAFDIQNSLQMQNTACFQLPYARPNLQYLVFHVKSEAEKRAHLEKILFHWKTTQTGSCLIYAATRGETEFLTEWCRLRGYAAQPFHAGFSSSRRKKLLHLFLTSKRSLFVATSAFGMGIHHDSLDTVIHLTPPLSLLAYAQESGRAGRGGQAARCILLYRTQDLRQIYEWQAERLTSRQQQKSLQKQAKIMHHWAVSTQCKADFLKKALTPSLKLTSLQNWTEEKRTGENSKLICRCSSCYKRENISGDPLPTRTICSNMTA